MNLGIVLVTYDRPHLLVKTLVDLNKSISSADIKINLVIIDDCSTNKGIHKIISDFCYETKLKWNIHQVYNSVNKRINNCLSQGFDFLIKQNCDILCNIDSDVKLKSYWLLALLRLQKMFPDNIISGFNYNFDRIEKPDIFTEQQYCVRPAAPGINMLFSKEIYFKYIQKGLITEHWDTEVAKFTYPQQKCIITHPSVIQHSGTGIGESTSTFKKQNKVIAEDFCFPDKIFDNT